MTTTCDLSVDWNRCAYCSELRDRAQSASDLRLACSQRLDQAWEEYRAERERGNVAFGTVTHRAWQARIDNLDRQLLAADAAAGEAIDEWADCIHEHHRRYEARQQETTGEIEETAATDVDEGKGSGPFHTIEAINTFDDAGLCVAVDLIYAMLDDITDLLRLDPHRLDGYRTQLTKTVFRRSGHESTSPCQGRRHAHSEGA